MVKIAHAFHASLSPRALGSIMDASWTFLAATGLKGSLNLCVGQGRVTEGMNGISVF